MRLADLNDKFMVEDDEFLEKRKVFAKKLENKNQKNGIYDYIDHFALYAGKQTLGNKIATYEFLKQTIAIPGHVLEFGTWKGANLLFLAKTLDLLAPNSPKLVIGFDNFAGLPDPCAHDSIKSRKMVGMYEGDEAILRDAVDLFNYENYVHLVVGDATETIPNFATDNPEVMVSFAYIDFDLYEPVKKALSFLKERLFIGGFIVFDEAISSIWPGETVALLEFLEDCDCQCDQSPTGVGT